MTIEEFRRLRDQHGLERYGESVAAHEARLDALQDPSRRGRFFPEWGGLSTRERGVVVRAAIAYERGEIERVSKLYEALKREMDGRKTA